MVIHDTRELFIYFLFFTRSSKECVWMDVPMRRMRKYLYRYAGAERSKLTIRNFSYVTARYERPMNDGWCFSFFFYSKDLWLIRAIFRFTWNYEASSFRWYSAIGSLETREFACGLWNTFQPPTFAVYTSNYNTSVYAISYSTGIAYTTST